MTELCERYGVSRKTGYKYLQRFEQSGAEGLKDLSRAPLSCPHKTSSEVERLVLRVKAKHRHWGARKIRKVLERGHPRLVLPAKSTIGDMLNRHGLVKHKRRRRKNKHPGTVEAQADSPNQIWPVDFKGQFRTQDGEYCYPLTITDLHSRYLLRCVGLPNIRTEGVMPEFERLFREVGLPDAIRSDNGAPFASSAIHGLCQLSVWWMKLGIVHQRIHPGSPQENGAHERMHRTLKQETTRPPKANMKAQQRRFNSWRKEYNELRPHETLEDETPASLWAPSNRPFPKKLSTPEYPGHMHKRLVSASGCFRMNFVPLFISSPLAGEYVGLEEIDDGIYNIFFYDTLLARCDLRKRVVNV